MSRVLGQMGGSALGARGWQALRGSSWQLNYREASPCVLPPTHTPFVLPFLHPCPVRVFAAQGIAQSRTQNAKRSLRHAYPSAARLPLKRVSMADLGLSSGRGNGSLSPFAQLPPSGNKLSTLGQPIALDPRAAGQSSPWPESSVMAESSACVANHTSQGCSLDNSSEQCLAWV